MGVSPRVFFKLYKWYQIAQSFSCYLIMTTAILLEKKTMKRIITAILILIKVKIKVKIALIVIIVITSTNCKDCNNIYNGYNDNDKNKKNKNNNNKHENSNANWNNSSFNRFRKMPKITVPRISVKSINSMVMYIWVEFSMST